MKTSRTVAHTSRPMLRAFRGAFFLSFSTVVQEDDDGDSDGVCCLTHLLPFLGDVFLRVCFFLFFFGSLRLYNPHRYRWKKERKKYGILHFLATVSMDISYRKVYFDGKMTKRTKAWREP